MTTLDKIRAEIADLDDAEYEFEGYYKAVNDALQIIDKYAEQEPCDDAVSREAVVDDFIEWREKLEYAVGEDYSGVHLLNVAIQKIWDMPSVRPQEQTGHWIEEDVFDGDVAYRCSECNELFWIESGTPKDNGYNFCPKCGKRLVEPKESEG